MELNSTATITSPNITDKDMKSENNSQSLVAYYQDLFDGEDIPCHHNPNDCQNTKRKSIGFRPNGIVALTSFEKPVITNNYDIAPSGVSFLHANERDVTNSEFKMAILILDSQTDFEYFIDRVKELPPKVLAKVVDQVPIGRLIEPKEVASFVGDLYRNEALAGDVFYIHDSLRLAAKG